MLLQPPGALPAISHANRADRRHYTPGRGGAKVRWIVLHNTEATDSRRWLSTDPASQVSIHCLIRNGVRENIVDYGSIAYHAGYTKPGAARNIDSLGVELENPNQNGQATHPYSEADYNTLAHLLATWCFSYGLDYDAAVVCHREIAVFPPGDPRAGQLGRRHDPSGLDLARVRRETLAWLAFFRQLPADQQAAWIV